VQFSSAVFRPYLRFWLVGCCCLLPQLLPHRHCRRTSFIFTTGRMKWRPCASQKLVTCGSRMKHFAGGKQTFRHETRGAPVGVSTLLIFSTRESKTKCIAWRCIQSVCRLPGRTKICFPLQAVFVHLCRS